MPVAKQAQAEADLLLTLEDEAQQKELERQRKVAKLQSQKRPGRRYSVADDANAEDCLQQ